jgi:STE24 endopeptidase
MPYFSKIIVFSPGKFDLRLTETGTTDAATGFKLERPKLLAVLAHELGHFKLKHLTRRLVLVMVGLFAMFFALSVMRRLDGLYSGLGFARVTSHAALVVFSLMVSEALAPIGWLGRIFSRRDERAADRFAVDATGNADDLKEALIALNKQNLSRPGSHPLYRHYHNSHPALKDRLKAIDAFAKARHLA